jgi:hypothetical protein
LKSIIVLFAVFLGTVMPVKGQIYLQLERSGSLKTLRYSPGDILTFSLKNDDKGWHERFIVSLDAAQNRIVLQDVVISLDSIESILLERKAAGAQIVGTALQAGGINLILYAGQDAIFRDRDFDWTATVSGLLNIIVGTAIKKIFRRSVFRISPRKRLRIVDLNFR